MHKLLLIIIIFLSITSISNASFWEPSSLDLYLNIDKWIDQLQDRMDTFELKWWEKWKWILSQINKYAIENQEPACLDESKKITIKQFNNIVENNLLWGKDWIMNYLIPNCLNKQLGIKSKENKNHIESILIKYMWLFKSYYLNSKLTAEIKSSQILKISKIGIYADWNEENSWFDLISDIQKIDKIIFSKVDDYKWKPIKNLDDALNTFLEPLNKKIDKLTSKNFWEDNTLDNNNSNPNKPIKIIHKTVWNSLVIQNTMNNYTCPVSDINNNWLSNSELSWLLNNIKNAWIDNWINSDKKNNIYNNHWSDDHWLSNQWLNPKSSNINSSWNYQKVTDNSQWPCETFFCIKIDMIKYQYNLFWWWKDITIEYLLNRSNKHLWKFASSSLIPAKMWTNNFELWLKDIKLPDLFHLSFQISTKPIPILQLESKSKKDETQFSTKNMLESYYKANWLDYKRRNDLDLLTKLENEKQAVNNSDELSVKNLFIKQQENNEIVKERQKKSATIMKSVENKVSIWILSTFKEQFTELDKFTSWIQNYTNTLMMLIRKLKEIPIEQ